MVQKKGIASPAIASLVLLFALVVVVAQQHSAERSSALLSSFSEDTPTGALSRGERLATQPITQPQDSASLASTAPQSSVFIPTPQEQQPQEPQFVRGSLLVKFKPGFAPQSVSTKVSAEFRFTQSRRLFQERHQTNQLLRDVYELTIPETVDPRLAAAEYVKLSEVEYAEPNFLAHTTAIRQPQQPAHAHLPNDPLYSQQWHLPKVSDVQAWQITQGNPATIIAVIDTGIFWSHPDLVQNIWINTGEIPNNGIDDDNNGYVDDVRGWDFVETASSCWPGEDCTSEDNDPNDFYGHGTHVAGIAGAVTDNGIGVAGICRKCRIMNVRAGFAYDGGAPYPYGLLEDDDIAEAITYAADNGARIISMSFGGSYATIIQNAVNYAYSQGVILVAAAGNSNSDYQFFPASYAEVISVAATDSNDNRAWFSNFGPQVDIAAPGMGIISTVIPGVTWGCLDTLGGYGSCSGTSMSTPLASGIIGLALSKTPNLTPNQILTLIHTAYDPIVGGEYIGTGRSNAFKAVRPLTVSLSLLDNSLDNAYLSTGVLNIIGTAGGQNFLKYRVDVGGPDIYPTSWITVQGDTFTPVTNGVLVTWNPSAFNLAPGVYTIRLLTTDTNQNVWEDRALVSVDTTLVPGWPKQIPEQTVSSPAMIDVDNDGRGEVFFQATPWQGFSTNPFAYDRFYAIDYNGLALPGWPITINGFGVDYLSPAIANIDSDTNFEAVYSKNLVGTGTSEYFIYEHSSSPQLGWPVTVGTGNINRISWGSPVFANIDGGNDIEVVVVTEDNPIICGSENKVYVYKQNGQILPGWPQQVNCVPRGTPAVGDVDANGDLEIVVSTHSFGTSADNNLYVFNHDGTALIGWPQFNVADFSSPVLADIDQNDGGKLEIIQGHRYVGNPQVYAFNHDGTVVPGFPFVDSSFSYSPAIGDIDNNGDLEIVFGTGGYGYVYALNHDGTIFPGWPVYTGVLMDGSPIIVDLDGNGAKEILVAARTKKLYGFNFDGTPTPNFPKPLMSWSYASASGDFDGDGLVDVFLIDFIGNMYRWEFGPITPTSFQWPMFHHDPQHTGRYP